MLIKWVDSFEKKNHKKKKLFSYLKKMLNRSGYDIENKSK